MAITANRNYIESILFIVASMMVIFSRCISTTGARQGLGIWYFPRSDSTINGHMRGYFFSVIYFIIFEVLRNSYVILFVTIFAGRFPIFCLYPFFITIIGALFARGMKSITFLIVNTEELNIFYLSAFATLFIHRNLQNKIPVISWVKHETTGRIDFSTHAFA